MDLYIYLITNVLNTHTETLIIGNYNKDVVVVVVSVIGAVVVACGPGLGMCGILWGHLWYV